jgi:hypothetical protein
MTTFFPWGDFVLDLRDYRIRILHRRFGVGVMRNIMDHDRDHVFLHRMVQCQGKLGGPGPAAGKIAR